MRSDLFVVSSPPDQEGERFALFDRGAFLTGSTPWSPEKWPEDFTRVLQSAEWLDEDDMRVELKAMGLSDDEVDDQLGRARNLHLLARQGTTWEHTTAVGYRNAHGQEVVRRTNLAGQLEGQRVYVLRCGTCGIEHDSDGCDVHLCRCPHCRDVPQEQRGPT